MGAAVVEGETGAGDEILDRLRDQHLARSGERRDPCPGVHGDAADLLSVELTLAGVDSCTDLDSQITNCLAGGHRTADRTRRPVERGQETVARGVDLAATETLELDTAGDGFLASFDGPARAIRCACSIVDGLGELDLEIRAGLHTGECELVDGKVAGIAVHTGARVAAQAKPGEVLVSSTVKDLVAGSGIRFADRGVRELAGVPGDWHLFAVQEI